MRGKIQYRDRARQLRDFSGLRFGNITPSDSDGEIEYHNKAWIFIEAKLKGVELPIGQRISLERKCDDMQKVKPTVLLIVSHETPVDQDIDMANAIVTEVRFKGIVKHPAAPVTTREYIDRFIRYVESGIET